MASAMWGQSKPLFECIDDNQKREGGSRWGPFEDEDKWQLAEWLIQNVSQRQMDNFLKLPIVVLYNFCEYFFNRQTQKCTQPTYGSNQRFLKKIDEIPMQAAGWICDIVTSPGNQLTDNGEPMPPERLELWR